MLNSKNKKQQPPPPLIDDLVSRHKYGINSVAFHPTAPFLATGSLDGTVKIWLTSPDGTAATCVATLDCFASVNSVAFHGRLPTLGIGSADNIVKLWK